MITEKDLEKLNFIKMQSETDDGIMPCTVYGYDYIDEEDESDNPYVFLTVELIRHPGLKEGEWVVSINPCEHTEEANLFINDLQTLQIMMGCFQRLYYYKQEADNRINLN